MPSPYITVLTPTFNRVQTLPRLVQSLRAQTFRDFEWLVVDDGSTDSTMEYLAGLGRGLSRDLSRGISQGSGRDPGPGLPFLMRVFSQPNGGKHRALNLGIPRAGGSWTFIVDSDDLLPPDSLEKLAHLARMADKDPSAGGIMGLKETLGGKIVGTLLPADSGPRDAATLTFADRIRGDKAEAFKTEILRNHPFPEFEGERFITECVVWFRIAREGWTLHLTNDVLYSCDYRDDGLSAQSLELRLKNPEGTLLFYAEELSLDFPGRLLFREAINLDRFAIHFRRLGPVLSELPPKGRLLAILALPAGCLAALVDNIRR